VLLWFDRLGFLVGEAFTALRRNRWMTFAAISTATAALFLLGGLFLTWLQVSRSAQAVGERLPVRAFFRYGAEQEVLTQSLAEARQIPGVRSVRLVTKEEGWKDFQKKYPQVAKDLDNPLPDSLHVQLTDVEQVGGVAARLQKLDGIQPDGVRYQNDQQKLVADGLRTLHIVGIALGAMMLLTSGVLIYNAIRLTIVARRREIRIMQLVGATRATVRAPMVIEGLFQGAIGGALAGALIGGSVLGMQRLAANLSAQSFQTGFNFGPWMFGLGLAGAAYGVLCSLFALRDSGRQLG